MTHDQNHYNMSRWNECMSKHAHTSSVDQHHLGWPELCQYLLYLTVVLHINHSKNIYKHNISLTGSPEHQQQPKSNTSCIPTMCQDKKPSYYHVQIVSNSLTWPDLLIQTHSALSGQVPILSVWLPRVLFYTDFFLLGTATILSHMSNWK